MKLRRRGARSGGLGELPLTSLIDVVFLLLIYFLVTATLTAPEAELSSALTRQSQRASAADLQPQIVSVEPGPDGAGLFRIGERTVRERNTLESILRDLPKEAGVFVKVQGDAPVSATAAALQASKNAGFVKVTYVPAK